MFDSKKKKFLKFFDANYSRSLGYVSQIVPDQAAAKSVIAEAMKRLWDKCVSERMESPDDKSLVAALDAEIRKYSNIYKRGVSNFHYEESDLQSLPEKRRAIFVMSRIEGLSSAEIASKLGISKRTVDKHLELAVKQLKNEL